MAARSGSGKEGPRGSTKIRFVLLEVDSADGNLSEITQAITNAVRPVVTAPKGPSAARTLTAASAAIDDSGDEDVVEEAVDAELLKGDEDGRAQSRGSTPRAQRKYAQPQLLHDVDLTTGAVPFVAYAQSKAPKKHSKRYLVIAAWFKEHGSQDGITIDHAYTCYRKIGWPTNIADFDLPFRQLVKRDWMRRLEPGKYSITHLGEDEVLRMGAPA